MPLLALAKELPKGEMGKKACLALDLDYDGDEIYDDNYFLTDEVAEESAKSSSQKSTHHVSKSQTIAVALQMMVLAARIVIILLQLQ